MQKRRVSLSLKLNILIICIILAVSVGLITITYRVHCENVDFFYYEKSVLSAVAASKTDVGLFLPHFRELIETDEFRQVQQKAAEANDEGIIEDWMKSRLSVFFDGFTDEEIKEMGIETQSLYDDYIRMFYFCKDTIDLFGVTNIYVQYEKDGVCYSMVDPEEGLLHIGMAEETISEFADHADNASIHPTVYRSDKGWLCTTHRPILDARGEEVVGVACVDIDMNDIMHERHMFLLNSAIFVVIELAVAIAVSMLLMRRAVIRPLNMLARATTGFGRGDAGYTRDDVIDLPIRANDEIGDLYREIRSMQGHIVDYTDHLARITAEKERARAELQMATNIQNSMLPHIFPAFPDRAEFDLYASMTPAREVGGDFYDYVMVDDDHLMLLIADVSDKGVPAALFMMSAKIIINYRAQMGGTPGEILTAANAQLCRNNKSKMFVTVWMGILELSTGRLTCTNAGHEYPFIRGQDGAFRLYRDKHGMPVGAVKRAKYADYEIALQPGDAIFVYTDGVPEANDAADALYGMDRLEAALNRAAGEDPQGILEAVKADVNAFENGADQFDDVTMLCLEYMGAGDRAARPE